MMFVGEMEELLDVIDPAEFCNIVEPRTVVISYGDVTADVLLTALLYPVRVCLSVCVR